MTIANLRNTLSVKEQRQQSARFQKIHESIPIT